MFVLFCTFPLTFACYQSSDIFIAVDAGIHRVTTILNDSNVSSQVLNSVLNINSISEISKQWYIGIFVKK